MLGRDYDSQTCSIARTLEMVGERWTILILRDVFLGVRRFDDLQQSLGIARNVLATRLVRLTASGILERLPYQERPVRNEYRLTEKGIALWPVIVELMQFGDRHLPTGGGPPTVLRHKDCGGIVGVGQRCDRCGETVTARQVRAEAGPGAGPTHPLRSGRRRVPVPY